MIKILNMSILNLSSLHISIKNISDNFHTTEDTIKFLDNFM